MDDRVSTLTSDPQHRSCADPFMLCELEEGKPDKLGHKVEQIPVVTKQGVYVHASFAT